MQNTRILIAALWSIAIGGMTFAVGPLSLRSEHSALAAIQVVLMALIVPGLLGAAAIAGNAHAFPLAPAAAINALVQFGACLLLIFCIRRFAWGTKAARNVRRSHPPYG